jgi:hypothetical protein
MARETRQEPAKPEPERTGRAPYQPPGIAWEEEFTSVAASGCDLKDPDCSGFGPPLPRE